MKHHVGYIQLEMSLILNMGSCKTSW